MKFKDIIVNAFRVKELRKKMFMTHAYSCFQNRMYYSRAWLDGQRVQSAFQQRNVPTV